MPTVTFAKEKKSIEVPRGSNLRKEALKAGVAIYPGIHKKWFANCHGNGHCGSCAVLVKDGGENVNRIGLLERLRLFFPRIDYGNQIRLSCRTKVLGDIEVETQPDLNWHGEKFWA